MTLITPPSQANNTQNQIKTLAVFCKYLLLERKQETELHFAFAALAQERHNALHTKTKDHKHGDGTGIDECDNDKCRAATAILKNSRQMAIEISDITINMVEHYNLQIEPGMGRSARAWLEPKIDLVKPEGGI